MKGKSPVNTVQTVQLINNELDAKGGSVDIERIISIADANEELQDNVVIDVIHSIASVIALCQNEKQMISYFNTLKQIITNRNSHKAILVLKVLYQQKDKTVVAERAVNCLKELSNSNEQVIKIMVNIVLKEILGESWENSSSSGEPYILMDGDGDGDTSNVGGTPASFCCDCSIA